MREIKFRAWDKIKKKMLFMSDGSFSDHPIWFLDTMECEEEYELMQFTGLKDKNGKEAYRKDEVSALGYSNWIIEWHKNGWKLKQKDTENYYNIPKDFIILGHLN